VHKHGTEGEVLVAVNQHDHAGIAVDANSGEVVLGRDACAHGGVGVPWESVQGRQGACARKREEDKCAPSKTVGSVKVMFLFSALKLPNMHASCLDVELVAKATTNVLSESAKAPCTGKLPVLWTENRKWEL